MNPNCVRLTIGHMAEEVGICVLIIVGFVLFIAFLFFLGESTERALNHHPVVKKVSSVAGPSLVGILAVIALSLGCYTWFMDEYSQQCPFSPVSIAWVKAHPPEKK